MKIIDLHCDTLYKFVEESNYSFLENDGHISEKELIAGNYLAQCFAIYTPSDLKCEEAFDFLNSQFKKFVELVDKSSKVKYSKNKNDIFANSEISAILTVENAEFLNQKIERLNLLEKHNVKIMGLIHNGENCLGYPHSSNEAKHNLPLKTFGKKVVEAISYSDIIIDVSHLNYGGFCDVANISKKPFIATHSACRQIVDHSRNLTDFQIRKIAESGGIIGLPFYSYFLNGTDKTEIKDILIHFEHLINIGGEDIAAIGTDFDGMSCELAIKSAGEMPILVDALIDKFGYNLAEKICYKNALRILN